MFGYNTPDQLRLNEQHGWDDENSATVIIEADSKEAALEWGREVAEAFVRALFDDQRMSWKAEGYADEIRPPSEAELSRIPVIRLGEYPDWTLLGADSGERDGTDTIE
jgi:hypothetical protein